MGVPMGSPATLKDISGAREDGRAGMSGVEGQDRMVFGSWFDLFKSGRMALIGQALPPLSSRTEC